MSDKLCVFAGSWRQYCDYCHENKLDRQKDAVWASRTSVMGFHFRKVAYAGSYTANPEFKDTHNYVMATLDRSQAEDATTEPLPFTKTLVTQTDAEKVTVMKKLLAEAADLMPHHTGKSAANDWWEKARHYVLDQPEA